MAEIKVKHPLYEERVDQWIRQRDVICGEDKIKQEGTRYLPKLGGQRAMVLPGESVGASGQGLSYEAYKARASFLNATGRTVEGLVGAILRKDPEHNWPKSREAFLEHMGSDGESFWGLIDEALVEVIGVGRYGQLVDAPASDSGENIEPFVASYYAEHIVDWSTEVIKGTKTLTMVKLLEEETYTNDKGEWKQRDRYRVCKLAQIFLDEKEKEKLKGLVPETEEEARVLVERGVEAFLALFGLKMSDFAKGPVYFQEIWVEKQTGEKATQKKFVRDQVIVPRMWGGIILQWIPFTFFNPGGIKPKPEKPILMDMTLLNLSHYRNSADYEHGLHFTALPQPWVAGTKFQGDLWIGSAVAWVMDDPKAQAGMLEFTGQGIGAIREAMEDKRKQMAMLGAKILEEQPKGIEAAETVRLRHSGEKSVLGRVAINVSLGLTQVLRWCGMWMRMSKEEVENQVWIELSSDFDLLGVNPQMLTAMISAVQAGQMSWQNMFWNLKRAEMYPDDVDEATEAARIIEGPPGMPKVEMEPEEEEEPEEEDDGFEEGEEESA